MRHLAASAAALVLLAGCLSAGSYIPIAEYLLSPPSPSVSGPPVQATLGVREFLRSEAVSLDIALLGEGGRQTTILNARWAESPNATLSRVVADSLRASGRFVDVGDAPQMARPDYTMTGELRRFHQDRTTEPWTAYVECTAEVRETFGPKVISAVTTRVTVPAPGETPAEMTSAFEQALTETARQIVEPLMAAQIP